LTVYRICRAKYPANDGEGARLAGGRWNHKGTPLVYCGATASLCALEVLAHSAKLPADMIFIGAGIPKSVSIRTIEETDLPAKWTGPVATKKTKDIGTSWAKSGATAVLSVPSVVVPNERNYLLNPAHPDFSKILFSAPKRFVFDKRLK
jgi:RES domain-containing protein